MPSQNSKSENEYIAHGSLPTSVATSNNSPNEHQEQPAQARKRRKLDSDYKSTDIQQPKSFATSVLSQDSSQPHSSSSTGPGTVNTTIPHNLEQPVSSSIALRLKAKGPLKSQATHLKPSLLIHQQYDSMSDGKNEARALRVLEIMNDFRTLQLQITSLVTRAEASPADQSAYYLDGYVVLRQCNAEAQAILATHYSPGSLGIEPGRIPDTEVQKATLQRIILDASTRRFSAHKIYLRAAAGMRWAMLRQQASGGNLSPGKKAQAFQAIDIRLREELNNITDDAVVNDLRAADRRKNFWLEEDPSLERMLQWIRRQR